MPRIKWTDKIWGKTREIIHTDLYSRHELRVVAGGYCSLHWHQHKANRFTVMNGSIIVVEMYGPVLKKFVLGPDNVHDVPSLVPHLFAVVKDGIVFEEYYPDRGQQVLRDDIIRIVEGGSTTVDRFTSSLFFEGLK